MKTVIILQGLPASGKTRFAEELVITNPGMYKRVNKDDLRAMLDVGRWSKDNEAFILRMRDLTILEALKAGKHVIVDDTNLNPKHIQHIEDLVKNCEYSPVKVEVKSFFDVSLEECINRDNRRLKTVGEKVIRQMYDQYLKPPAQYAEQDGKLPRAIIVDIDGTLAKMTRRSPYEWDRVNEDAVNYPIKKIMDDYKGQFIFLITGRDAECKTQTEAWLRMHDIKYDNLFMRTAGDDRKDSVVKNELFMKYLKDKYYVDFVLDDRDQVVEFWRSLGFTCLQVDYGNF